MEISKIIELMLSDDYRERFIAEYWLTKIRYDKIHKMCVKYEAGTLEFDPASPLDLLKRQTSYMGKYLKTLEIRAEIEGINLDV